MKLFCIFVAQIEIQHQAKLYYYEKVFTSVFVHLRICWLC